MGICGKYTLVKWIEGRATAHPLKCRCWTCANCYDWRRKALISDAKAGRPTTMITLTSNPKWGKSPTYRAQQLVVAWRVLIRELRRRPEHSKTQYLVVMEKTKKGEPHLHILLRGPFVPQKWLSRRMAMLMRAPIVDIRRVNRSKGVAEYVTKYIGKDPKRYEGCKRYWRSMDWLHPTASERRAARDPSTVWYLVRENYAVYRKRLLSAAVLVERDSNGTTTAKLADGRWCPPGTRPVFDST